MVVAVAGLPSAKADCRVTVRRLGAAAGSSGNAVRAHEVQTRLPEAAGAFRWSGRGEPERVNDESGRDVRKSWSTQVEARLSAAAKVADHLGRIALESVHLEVLRR